MAKIFGFAFANKSSINTSGVCLQITATRKKDTLKLYRQIDDYKKLEIAEFKPMQLTKGIYSFDIRSKYRDIYALRNKIKEAINKNYNKTYDSFDEIKEETRERGKILELWHQYFNSPEIILDSYKGYYYVETPNKLWFYDSIPAIKDFSMVNDLSRMPLPGTNVTYSVYSEVTKTEIYTKSFLIPEPMPGTFELNDIFKEDPYLYHIGLIVKNKCIWGIFSDRPPKDKPQIAKATSIHQKSFICQIKPDITELHNVQNISNTFYFNDIPPNISYNDIMSSSLRISKIKIDTENPDNFNYINFHTRYFKAINFPKTFSIIYPYK